MSPGCSRLRLMMLEREEEKKRKEMIAQSIRNEQKEVRARPVIASKAVHLARPDTSSNSGGDGVVRYVNSDSEFQKMLSVKTYVLANFTASWCGPCKMIAPQIEAMAARFPHVTFVKIDIDENRETPGRFSVSAVPTFILFENGKQKGSPVQGANAAGVEALVAQVR